MQVISKNEKRNMMMIINEHGRTSHVKINPSLPCFPKTNGKVIEVSKPKEDKEEKK